jgi:type IV secretion system protein VirB10
MKIKIWVTMTLKPKIISALKIMFSMMKKEHGKDDFERQDAFENKPKTSVKNIDIGKLVKFGGLLALIIGLVIFGVYLKLQKNKESRVESGVESAVAKPVTGMDGSNFNGMDRFGFEIRNQSQLRLPLTL